MSVSPSYIERLGLVDGRPNEIRIWMTGTRFQKGLQHSENEPLADAKKSHVGDLVPKSGILIFKYV